MNNIKKILKESLPINEAGFKIKEKGKLPKSIKLFHHVDLDGIVSAMVAYRQLVKQGMPPNRIELRPVQYGNQKPEFFNVKPGQKAVMVDYSELPEGARVPDILSDHHIKRDELKSVSGMRHGEVRSEKRIESEPEKTQRSDTERLAVLHAPQIAGREFVNKVSKVDSAQLGDMYNMDKMVLNSSNIQNVVNFLLTALAKEDLKTGDPNAKSTGATEWLIRNGPLSMVGLYNLLTNKNSPLQSVLHNEIDLVKELQKSPDQRDESKLKELMGSVSKATLRKAMRGEARKKAPLPLNVVKQQHEKQKEEAITPEKTSFKAKGNVIVSELSGANQPHRYLGSMLTKKDLSRYPALMRAWPGMVQIALNPDIEPEVAKNIDLNKIVHDAIDEMANSPDQKWNGWAWKIIREGAGGHTGIANVPSIYLLNLGPKDFREELKKVKDMKSRAAKITLKSRSTKEGKEKVRDLKKRLDERLKELEKRKEFFDEKRKTSVEKLKNLILQKVNDKLKGVKVKPLSQHPEEYQSKPRKPEEENKEVKENILRVLNNSNYLTEYK